MQCKLAKNSFSICSKRISDLDIQEYSSPNLSIFVIMSLM
ncbi:hypothetical protein CPK_ORF00208 [Chlamydia pneumoniae LPCoLN]|nr:hypothetical protein CPK_ORF00208 [Chlamydia pneumoniae LPCoLN]ETR79551.1 hypothetical protein X556_1124 [Chlamydia pneumoniae B21]